MKLSTILRRLADSNGIPAFSNEHEIAYAVRELGKLGITKKSGYHILIPQVIKLSREMGRMYKGLVGQEYQETPKGRAEQYFREAPYYKGVMVTVNNRGPVIKTVRVSRVRRANLDNKVSDIGNDIENALFSLGKRIR